MLISSGEPIPLFSFVHGWFCVCEDELGLGLGFREKFEKRKNVESIRWIFDVIWKVCKIYE